LRVGGARLFSLAIGLGVLGAGCTAPSATAKDVVRGPIAGQAMQPLAWSLGDLRPRRALATPRGAVDVSIASCYASIFRVDDTDSSEVEIDGELWHNALGFRAGVIDGADLEIELPILYASSGVLDGFIDFWHDLFGLPSGRRDLRPEGDYAMSVESNGDEIWELEGDEPMLGDVPVTWTQELFADATQALAWRAMIELPTGSESRGASNGELDWGVGLVGERHFERWSLFGALDHLHSGEPTSFDGSGVHLRDRFEVALGGEYRWNDRTSLLGSLEWTSPFTRDLDLKVINREILDFGLGAAWDVGESSRFAVSFHEDLVSNTGADFAVLVGWTMRL
jgi:hypothetical protein